MKNKRSAKDHSKKSKKVDKAVGKPSKNGGKSKSASTSSSSKKKSPFSMSLSMDETIEDISVEDIYDVINDKFVSKLLEYLRGDAKSVSTHAEFTTVYQMIIHHCDNRDNND